MVQQNKYKEHISGLKGFACIMVMIGHFIGLYKYAEEFPVKIAIVDVFLNSKLDFILDETYWVNLFFIISGYLVAMSRIEDGRSLFKKCIKRFLRLGMPILGACLFIWIIQESAGFYTEETNIFFTNTWIQEQYPHKFSIVDVLLSPFNVLILNNVEMNSPYWVLRDMFISSLMIYILTWLKNKLREKRLVIVLLAIIFFVIGLVTSRVICAVLIGMFLLWIQEDYKEIIKEKWIPYFLMFITMSLYFISREYLSFIFFGILIIFIPKTKLINSILTSKIGVFFGKISFGIYSFHWPIFCSIGMMVVLEMTKEVGLIGACLLAIGVSILITVVLSVVFYITIERVVSILLRRIEKKV